MKIKSHTALISWAEAMKPDDVIRPHAWDDYEAVEWEIVKTTKETDVKNTPKEETKPNLVKGIEEISDCIATATDLAVTEAMALDVPAVDRMEKVSNIMLATRSLAYAYEKWADICLGKETE